MPDPGHGGPCVHPPPGRTPGLDAVQWQPRREAGLARLQAFLPRAGARYAEWRNHDFGPGERSNVSCLSPWIRHRLLSEIEVAGAALRHHGCTDCGKFLDEVFWHTYFRGWLEMRPGVWAEYRRQRDAAFDRMEHEASLYDRWQAATAGRTGIDAFDTWAGELVAHGYLHNHARMWFASIWIFTLGLPWALGADFFLRHLLDGDAASNTLSWRWVAGLQTPGKTYRATAENIRRFTDGRLDPGESLAASAEPVAAVERVPPGPAPTASPRPAARADRTGLLLSEDDLGIETLPIASGEFAAAAVLDGPAARSPLPLAPGVGDFVRGAIADTAGRMRSLHGHPLARLADAPALRAWLDAEGIDTLLVPHVPVGPGGDRLSDLRAALGPRAPTLHRVLRDADARAWPLATHGFFRFRKHIPELLRAAGLPAEDSEA